MEGLFTILAVENDVLSIYERNSIIISSIALIISACVFIYTIFSNKKNKDSKFHQLMNGKNIPNYINKISLSLEMFIQSDESINTEYDVDQLNKQLLELGKKLNYDKYLRKKKVLKIKETIIKLEENFFCL